MLLFGASLFAATLAPGVLRPEADRRVRRIASIAVPLAATATLIRLPLTAAGMGDGWADALEPATLGTVLSASDFGHAWALQIALVAVLAAAARGGSVPGLAGASGAVLGSLALSGHAAAEPGAIGWLTRGGLALHVLAAGAWIGSLPEVLALMRNLRSGRNREAAVALRRFSVAGHGTVALLIGSGVLDTLLIAGPSRDLPVSAYGAVLLGKAALAGGMAALATVNRYRLVPRLPRDPAGAGLALRRNTRAVLWLGFGAIAASGLLGLLDPP